MNAADEPSFESNIAFGSATIVDFRGRIYYTGPQDSKNTTIVTNYQAPSNPLSQGSDIKSGVFLRHMMAAQSSFTDDKGQLHSANIVTGSDTTIDTGAARFRPNTYACNFMTDHDGGVWNINLSGASAITDGEKQLKSKPDTSICADNNEIIFTDQTGQIWQTGELSTGTTSATPIGQPTLPTNAVEFRPNQIIAPGYSSYYYAGANGHLYALADTVSSGTGIDVDTGITGLTPGTIYPGGHMVVADGNGKVWELSEGVQYKQQHNIGAGVAPGTYSVGYRSQSQVCRLIAVDSQGTLYAPSDTSALTAYPGSTFPANQLGLACMSDRVWSGNAAMAFLASNDGTVYRVDVGQTAQTRVMPTGLYVKGSTTSQTFINQMPVTGAPEGLSIIGVAAVATGVFGLSLALIRRSRI